MTIAFERKGLLSLTREINKQDHNSLYTDLILIEIFSKFKES